MVVIFKKREAPPSPKPKDDAFARWYETHKNDYNSKRREKYKQDPAYKTRVLNTARQTRDNRRKYKEKPSVYSFTINDVADDLGITIWTLRNWRGNGYFPEPYKFNGELWFSQNQISLLSEIRDFLVHRGIKRMSAVQRDDLQPIIESIHARWQN